MARKLLSVEGVTSSYPFSQGQVRWLVFNAESNGLAERGVVCRIGRRVYFDEDRLDAWIDEQNGARKRVA